jgi:hyperosmotically inducible periplasmic protein
MTRKVAIIPLLLAVAALMAGRAAADPPDSWITTKAKIALLTSDDVTGTSINVDTVHGKVTLHGKVSTAAEKTRATEITRKIDGVKTVNNLLQVVPSSRRKEVKASDSEIKDRVNKVLDRDPALNKVSVASVNSGVVLLKGKVDNLPLALRAIERANEVDGVRRVSSEIETRDEGTVATAPSATSDEHRRSHHAEATHEEHAHQAEHARDAEHSHHAEHESDRAKDKDKDAHRGESYSGKTPARAEGEAEKDRPDAWVTMKTKLALLTSDDVSGTHINVDTRNGKVILQGKVETQAEKAKAEDVTRKIDGVKDVQNLLQVVPSSRRDEVKASDKEIESRVEKALASDSSLKGISVASVNNGVVVLKGDTKTLGQNLRAVETASKVGGVRRVASEIKVEKE